MDNKLDVRNLRISFRTNNGLVRAVRNISFSIEKGQTLAIVGESGSGKSVTARAVIGILAPNAIVEGGEIFYDGMDLLKIPEEEFHKIRGNRISMIFQDPLSALNPIVRIGKQITEAMILNSRASRRAAHREYKQKINLLRTCCIQALNAEGDAAGAAKVDSQIAVLKKFISHGCGLEKKYNAAKENANNIISDIDGVLTDIIRGVPKDIAASVNIICRSCLSVKHEFVIVPDECGLTEAVEHLRAAGKAYGKSGSAADKTALEKQLSDVKKIIESELEKPAVNFFTLGYYDLYCEDKDISNKDINGLNARSREYLDNNFMLDFLGVVAKGMAYSENQSKQNMADAVGLLKEGIPAHKRSELVKAVENSIDRLAISKDSFAYTFRTSIKSATETCERAIKLQDVKHPSKHDREFLSYADVDLCKNNVDLVIRRVIEDFESKIAANPGDAGYADRAVAMIDHIKEQASEMIYTVSKRTAKARAIKLMEEVSIPEARKRYKQYPFEFSGGMRQRVVIAIALASNPDILICDEPTTALDVTVQAQILELINKIKEERHLTVIFITHDLGVVANMADKIAVMYAGKIVESGNADDVFYSPAHPYTWALLSSMPDLDTKEKLEAIPGTPPNMIFPPKGDAFAARNKYAMEIDFEEQPPEFRISDTHYASTWLLHPDAPKVDPPKTVTDRIARMKKLNEETERTGGEVNG